MQLGSQRKKKGPGPGPGTPFAVTYIQLTLKYEVLIPYLKCRLPRGSNMVGTFCILSRSDICMTLSNECIMAVAWVFILSLSFSSSHDLTPLEKGNTSNNIGFFSNTLKIDTKIGLWPVIKIMDLTWGRNRSNHLNVWKKILRHLPITFFVKIFDILASHN